MFCPKCGSADQKEDTYCRRCGAFLPDFDKLKKKETAPETHLKANAFMTALTAVVSLTLAILLYSFFLGRNDTPVLIYITASFLIAMFFWQAQTFWRTLLLKKQFPKRKIETGAESIDALPAFEPAKTSNRLKEADYSSIVPPSVVENTTRKLKVESEKKNLKN